MYIQTVGLVGMGSIGSFFAPRLYETLRGNFTLIADPVRKQRLMTQDIVINSVSYHFPVLESSEGRFLDLILIAVKYRDFAAVLEEIAPFVGPQTQILCLMNGISTEQELAKRYGWDHVLYSVMRVSIEMKNNTVVYDPESGFVLFGEAKNEGICSERVLAVKELFDACSIPCHIPRDMLQAMWFKFACNVGENMTCAMLGIPFGAFRVSREADMLRELAVAEVIKIAAAKGITISEEKMRRQSEVIAKLPFSNRPSTAQDLANGRKTEVELFAGQVVRLGEELGIDTPVCRMFLMAIHVLEQKNSGLFQ